MNESKDIKNKIMNLIRDLSFDDIDGNTARDLILIEIEEAFANEEI